MGSSRPTMESMNVLLFGATYSPVYRGDADKKAKVQGVPFATEIQKLAVCLIQGYPGTSKFEVNIDSPIDFLHTLAGLKTAVVGPGAREFIKVAAMQMAKGGNPLPHELWFGGYAEYYDIDNIVTPHKSNTLAQALGYLLPDYPVATAISSLTELSATKQLEYTLRFVGQLGLWGALCQPHISDSLKKLKSLSAASQKKKKAVAVHG